MKKILTICLVAFIVSLTACEKDPIGSNDLTADWYSISAPNNYWLSIRNLNGVADFDKFTLDGKILKWESIHSGSHSLKIIELTPTRLHVKENGKSIYFSRGKDY